MPTIYCDVGIHPDDIAFAKRALSAPGMVPDAVDLIIGDEAVTGDVRADVRLCGTDGEPAQLCAAIYRQGGEVLDYVHSDGYAGTFVLTDGPTDYTVSLRPDGNKPVACLLLREGDPAGDTED